MTRSKFCIASLLCVSFYSLCLHGQVPLAHAAEPLAMQTWQTPDIPDTTGGKLFARFLTAFNSADGGQLEQFVRSSSTAEGPGGMPIDMRVGSMQRLFNSSQGLNVYQVQQLDESRFEAIVQFRLTEQWRKLVFMLDGPEKSQLFGMQIMPIPAPDVPESTTLPFEVAMQQYVRRLASYDQFSGVLAISRDGKLIFETAAGSANREENLPNTTETAFNYASVGKMFTAVAIAQQLEAGHLQLSNTVAEMLPDFSIQAAHPITVDQLLTHQSGLPDFLELLDHMSPEQRAELPQGDELAVIADQPLRFQPGERFEYSNTNFVILGRILEKLTGKSYENVIIENIFKPTGMTQTALNRETLTDTLIAKGYTELSPTGQFTPGQRHFNPMFSGGTGGPAGGGVTTAGDMLKFASALRSEQLISAKTLELLLEKRVPGMRPGESYARGFIVRESSHGEVFGHSGGYPGVDAQIDISTTGWTVIVLCNYEAVGEPVARHAEDLLNSTLNDHE